MTIKKDAVIIQIKTRKKKYQIKTRLINYYSFFMREEKKRQEKPKSYIYTYYSKSKPYRSAKKKIFQISQKNEAA